MNLDTGQKIDLSGVVFDDEESQETDLSDKAQKARKKTADKKRIRDYEAQTGKSAEVKQNHSSFRNYGMILYPCEDRQHNDVLRYLQSHQDYFQYLAINHKGELHDAVEQEIEKRHKEKGVIEFRQDSVLDVGDLPYYDTGQDVYAQIEKLRQEIFEQNVTEQGLTVYDADAHTLSLSYGKDHTHLLVDTIKPMTRNAFLKFWGGMVKYVEPISNPVHYVRYMLHDTPTAELDGKIPYHVPDLYGSPQFIAKQLIVDETLYFIQLQDQLYAQYHDMSKAGYSLSDIFEALYLCADDQQRYVFRKTFPNMGYLMVSMQKQQYDEKKEQKKAREKHNTYEVN